MGLGEGAKKRPPLPVLGRSRAHQGCSRTKAAGRSACTLSMLLYAAGGLPAFVYCWGPIALTSFPGRSAPTGAVRPPDVKTIKKSRLSDRTSGRRKFKKIVRLSFNSAGRCSCVMTRLGLDASCSDLRMVSPPFCGSSPYPCRSLTYQTTYSCNTTFSLRQRSVYENCVKPYAAAPASFPCRRSQTKAITHTITDRQEPAAAAQPMGSSVAGTAGT